ncbi:thermonuclease family protein [Nonomuraea aurantiaca]|uniref:thermonuclease family protein n=1 Tax=Nonomuraea aurantiaca TaxID=2878562 RepID=UPI001CDA0FE8|nr:excalibur calcium-binding domain-containing protein [Nonomuraea aurantiaca]MCA2219953.1 excalibur calcium-binding domain-containing protein [Nonomuraea aurantiaca]
MRILSLTAVVLLAVPAPAYAAGPPAGVPKGAMSVRVAKIVNGDTIDVTTGDGKKTRVVFLESDAPALGQCWAKAATQRTAALLPVGRLAYVVADKKPTDGSGRRLFYVWNAKGVHVNRNLVRYGYAKALLVKPNDRYITVMRSEEAVAKRQKLRIWSGKCDTGTTTPAPTGDDRRFRTCGEANAAGYGPYRKGVDPEYAWYQDRDGDGLVCER